jgi:hypothetical protein
VGHLRCNLLRSFFRATLSRVQGQQDESTGPSDRARDRRPRKRAALGGQIREDRDPDGKQSHREQLDGVNRCWPGAIERHILACDPIIRNRSPQSGGLQYPDPDGDHHDDIQNRLDAGLHGDKTIDQPQREPDHNQRDDEIN